MLDLSAVLSHTVAIHDLDLLAEAVDYLDKLDQDPAKLTEHGPSESDIRQAAYGVIELAEKVDNVARAAARSDAAEVLDGLERFWA